MGRGGSVFSPGDSTRIPSDFHNVMSVPNPATGDLFKNQTQPSPRVRARAGVWLLPLALLLGFALVFALLFRDRLLPAKTVAVVPAVGIEETIAAPAPSAGRNERMLFQASGWVEPIPCRSKRPP